MNSSYFLIPQTKKAHPKFKFGADEDLQLKELVRKYGENNWTQIAQNMPNRNARQCKERWCNYLSPNICKSPWTQDEDNLLLEKYKEIGARWVQIAKFFPQRTDISIKNRYLVLSRRIKKKLPKTKSPNNSINNQPQQTPIAAVSSANLLMNVNYNQRQTQNLQVNIGLNSFTNNIHSSNCLPHISDISAGGNILLLKQPSSPKLRQDQTDIRDDENLKNAKINMKPNSFKLPPIQNLTPDYLTPDYFPPISLLPPKKAILGIQTRTLLHCPPEASGAAKAYVNI